MNWANALAIAEKGFETWAAKDHNRKWVRKIDGTPIKNDLLVNIATAFAVAHVQPAPIAGLEPVAWQPIKTAPRDGTPLLHAGLRSVAQRHIHLIDAATLPSRRETV